jgi:bifunctional DNA-binding transcriptional regulator/antitoxin component of YhaV-PrlF toxin-antitoxin module
MTNTGEVRVSQRGQMSLPAMARHRWGLDDGGDVSFIDLGDAVVLLPEGVDELRDRLIDSVTDDDWDRARRALGDPDLVSE